MAADKQNTNKVLSDINSIMSALQYFSDGEGNVNIYLSDLLKLNSLNFIVKYFEKVKGKTWLIKTLASLIGNTLPKIEAVVKTTLLGYVESMLSCSVKPFITQQMILDGVYFDLQSIDLFNILNIPPELNTFNEDSLGKYVYFGIDEEDGIKTMSDLWKCRDMNAVLWYTKNNPGKRVVWKRETDVDSINQMKQLLNVPSKLYKVQQKIKPSKQSPNEILVTRYCYRYKNGTKDRPAGEDYYDYKTIGGVNVTTNGKLNTDNGFMSMPVLVQNQVNFSKQPKSNGIVTLEYNAKSSNMTDSEHNPMYVCEPLQNCLHVFIGCCSEVNLPKEELEQMVEETNVKIEKYKVLVKSIEECIDLINDKKTELRRASIKEKTKKSLEVTTKINIMNEEIAKLKLFKSGVYGIKDSKTEYNSIIDVVGDVYGKVVSYYESKINPAITISEYDYKLLEDYEKNDYKPIYGSPTEINVELDDFSYKIIIDQLISGTTGKKLDKEKMERVEKVNNQSTGVYPNAQSNYYFLHPMIEFNTDLIFSMKLFDEKTLCAQLINALTGCLEFGSDFDKNGLASINISFNEQLIKEELGELIQKIIENEDTIVSDCFFAFDNDKFNSMLQKTEMRRIGLHSLDGENAMEAINPNDVLSALNEISSSSSKEEIVTAIEHCIFTAVSQTHKGFDEIEYDMTPKISFNGVLGVDLDTSYNVVEELLKKLIYVIVSTILMPKIYMIIMFNMKLMDNDVNGSFDLSQYIDYCKSMLVDIIANVRDEVIGYLKDYVMSSLQELLKRFAPLMLNEQYMYYRELLTNCTECLRIKRLNGKEYDWTQDSVYYADIDSAPQISTNDEC